MPPESPDPAGPDRLSVVMPVYNEPDWIGRSLRAVDAALAEAGMSGEIIVVDDGSDAATGEAIRQTAVRAPLRVLRQENSGRFVARRTGIEAARENLILLLDSRVTIDPTALVHLRRAWDPDRPAWNAHVVVEVDGDPYARFWNVLTDVAFASYFADPRETSFGPAEFDRFPKGTTCFVAPRADLLTAMDGFRSAYADLRQANDDTPVIRDLAGRYPIRIGPGFSCRYHGKRSFKRFVKHAAHRGGVFLDGYGRPGTRFFGVIVAFYPLSLASLWAAARSRRLAAAGLAALPLAGYALGARWRRPAADRRVLALLGPVWLCSYASGLWLGLLRAARARFGR